MDIFQELALVGDQWVLWALVAASVLSLAVMLERGFYFWKNRTSFTHFIEQLTSRLEHRDLIGARRLALEAQSLEARVALAGLNRINNGFSSVEEAMVAQLVLEKTKAEKNLMVLGTLGNNAPFLGLLGTVLGIIKAFHDLGVSNQSGIAVVMSGISSALIATALGILVAIPAVAANNYFLSQARRATSHGQSLIHWFQVFLQEERHRQEMPKRSVQENNPATGGGSASSLKEEDHGGV